MNLAFVAISTLVKSNIGEKCLINFLMNVSAQALIDLECSNIYKKTSPKKKSDLIEMIICGCITEKLNKKEIEDISIKQAKKILNKSNITIKSLPGYGNAALRKKKSNHMLKKNHLLKYEWYQIKKIAPAIDTYKISDIFSEIKFLLTICSFSVSNT